MGWLENYNDDGKNAVMSALQGFTGDDNPYSPILQLMGQFMSSQHQLPKAQTSARTSFPGITAEPAAQEPDISPVSVSAPVIPVSTQEHKPASRTGAIPVSERAREAFKYLVKKGTSPIAAAGIVGNIAQESGFNPGVTNSIGAFGLAQWLGARKQNLMNTARARKIDPADFYFQLDYLLSEPHESSRALAALSGATSPEQAALIWTNKYERPGKGEANYRKRQSVARSVYDSHQTGGSIAVAATKQQQAAGLNSGNYDAMFFPVAGANLFHGLDNDQPVHLKDATGKSVVLRGIKDKAIMRGPVVEQRIKNK